MQSKYLLIIVFIIYFFSDDEYEFFSKETVEGWVKSFYTFYITVDSQIQKIASLEKMRDTFKVTLLT